MILEPENKNNFNFGTAAEIKISGPKLDENSIFSPYVS